MAWLGFGATCGLALCGLWALADRLRTHPTPLRNADGSNTEPARRSSLRLIGIAALVLATAAIAAAALFVAIISFR